jgi:hypothetical protein
LAPEFDQRPGELEATRTITIALPTVMLTRDPAREAWQALMLCETPEVLLTVAQMRMLATNLLEAAAWIEERWT